MLEDSLKHEFSVSSEKQKGRPFNYLCKQNFPIMSTIIKNFNEQKNIKCNSNGMKFSKTLVNTLYNILWSTVLSWLLGKKKLQIFLVSSCSNFPRWRFTYIVVNFDWHFKHLRNFSKKLTGFLNQITSYYSCGKWLGLNYKAITLKFK